MAEGMQGERESGTVGHICQGERRRRRRRRRRE